MRKIIISYETYTRLCQHHAIVELLRDKDEETGQNRGKDGCSEILRGLGRKQATSGWGNNLHFSLTNELKFGNKNAYFTNLNGSSMQ